MPALRPSARWSTRLAAKSQAIFKASTMIPSTDFGANHQAPFHFPPPQNSGSYPQQYVPSPTQPIPPSNKPQKRTKKRAQESNEESKSGIYWEQRSHLTASLLSWLLDHLEDRAILFNESKGGTTKSHLKRAKRIRLRLQSRVWFSRKTAYIQRHIPKIRKDFLWQ